MIIWQLLSVPFVLCCMLSACMSLLCSNYSAQSLSSECHAYSSEYTTSNISYSVTCSYRLLPAKSSDTALGGGACSQPVCLQFLSHTYTYTICKQWPTSTICYVWSRASKLRVMKRLYSVTHSSFARDISSFVLLSLALLYLFIWSCFTFQCPSLLFSAQEAQKAIWLISLWLSLQHVV